MQSSKVACRQFATSSGIKKSEFYTFWRQFDEKPSVTMGCPKQRYQQNNSTGLATCSSQHAYLVSATPTVAEQHKPLTVQGDRF